MHVVESFVNFFEFATVGDVLVNLEPTTEIVWLRQTLMSTLVSSHGIDGPSTRPGSSVRPFTPPKAVPRQTRPVTYAT